MQKTADAFVFAALLSDVHKKETVSQYFLKQGLSESDYSL